MKAELRQDLNQEPPGPQHTLAMVLYQLAKPVHFIALPSALNATVPYFINTKLQPRL